MPIKADDLAVVFNICVLRLFLTFKEPRGQILGRNPDKSIKSFPPCYSKSLLQLCLEISISSEIQLQFHQSLLYTVKEKGGKSDRKSHPLPYGLRHPYRNLKS
jgi:hypothetical protein